MPRSRSSIIAGKEIAAHSARFTRFADRECGASPLYRGLANGIAADGDLLRLAATARHGPAANLFLAAVHDLLLQGYGADLAAYYPTIVGADALPPANAIEAFADFVRSDPNALKPALQGRLVQTNEIRRAAVLYPALCWLRAHHSLDEVALVEVGTSAGLLLATDRFEFRFGTTKAGAVGRSNFVIETDLRGASAPVDGAPPEIVERIGIDLCTLDLTDEADRRWLRALIWGDQPERLQRLDNAIEIARRSPMSLLEGDANEALPGVLDALADRLPAIVFHSHTLNQFSPAARKRFDEVLRAASRTRDVYRISMEGRIPHPTCTTSVYRDGNLVESVDLAHYDAHGAWIEWLAS